MKLSKEYSEVITIVKVLCMFGVIYIHASVVPYVDCSRSMLYYQQFITRVLTSFAVPGFFICSGFLYFLNFNGLESFQKKSISRFKSLAIPYLFWIALSLIVTWFIQDIFGFAYLFGAGNLKLIHDFSFKDFACSFWSIRNGAPFLSTMWFLRDLMVCMIITPQLFLLLKSKYGKFVLTIILILSLWGLSFAHIAVSSIFWFSLGAFIAIHEIDIFAVIRKRQKVIPIGLLIVIVYSLVFTEDKEIRTPFYSILQILTTIVLFTNILLLAMNLVGKKYGNRLAKLGVPSYFIYLAHEPYMGYVLQLFIRFINYTPPTMYIVCITLIPIILPIFIISACLIAFKGLKKCFPKGLSFVIGGKV